MKHSRRDFLAGAGVAMAAVGLSGCRTAGGAMAPKCLAKKHPFQIGMARVTLMKRGYPKALEILQSLDCRELGLMENTISYDASQEEIDAFKANAAKFGVEIVTAGPLGFSKMEEVEPFFRFARNFGLKSVSVVPFEWHPKIRDVADNEARKKILPPSEWRLESDCALDMLEECVKKYGVKAAIHNHGPDLKGCYPTAEAALARIGNRDRRIGVCLDVGHEWRGGGDPVEFIRRHGDRVVEVHIKNLLFDREKKYIPVTASRGDLDIRGIFAALLDAGFRGPCLMECERYCNDEMSLAESIGYYRGVMDALDF